jgi:hypothetical protein
MGLAQLEIEGLAQGRGGDLGPSPGVPTTAARGDRQAGSAMLAANRKERSGAAFCSTDAAL